MTAIFWSRPRISPWLPAASAQFLRRSALRHSIIDRLNHGWSPEQIAGRRHGSALRDREAAQSAMGPATALLGAGRAFLIDAMTNLVEALDGDEECLMQARVTLRLACTFAGESALQIADLLAAEAGTAAILESCTIERSIRDLQAATKHIAMSANSYIIGGRHALGMDPGPKF